MRLAVITPILCLLTGCLAPGERDPTRYPWESRNKVAVSPVPHPRIVAGGAIAADPSWQPQPPPMSRETSYCIMAIEQERESGISISANSGVMACSAPADPAPRSPPR